MLQRIKFFVFLSVLLMMTEVELFSQSIHGPVNPNSYREIVKVGNEALQSSLIPSNSFCIIGKNMVSGQQAFGRLVFQWNMPDNVIPDYSTITSVTLHFTYTKINHTYEMSANFSSLSIDNSNPTQSELDQMWSQMSNTAFGGQSGNNDVMDYTSNNSTDPFNIAVRDALLNDRFVVGVSASLSPSITDRVWNIQNPSVTLSIEYIPPTQTVTLDQRLSNNTQVGKLRKWEGTQFTQYPFINPGTQFVFPVNSVQTIQGDLILPPYSRQIEKQLYLMNSKKYRSNNDRETTTKKL